MVTSERKRRTGVASSLATAIAFLLFAVRLVGAENVLFPEPLHLTREIADGITGKVATVDEYAVGNRVISISATRTAIADHSEGTLTVIDFAAGTYSITPFETLAAHRQAGARRVTASRAGWRLTSREPRSIGARAAETFSFERVDGDVRHVVRLSADRDLTVSRPAAEVLLGVGYPDRNDEGRSGQLESLRVVRSGAIATDSEPQELFRLPLEQVDRVEADGEVIESRNRVVRVGHELPPADRTSVPPGATRVESSEAAARRLIDEIDGTSPRGH